MLEKVEMGEKSNSHNTIIEKKIRFISCWWRIFSQKGVEASKKTKQKQNTANQIAPEISLKLFKVKVLQVFLFVPQKHLRPVNMCRL